MRTALIYHLLLSLVWMALTGGFSLANFVFGAVVCFFLLRLVMGVSSQRYFTLLPRALGFVGYFLYELLKANIQVAADVITPPFYMKPGIVGVPLTAETDTEISLLANLITLTPGTLSLDVSDDRKTLYVHVMYLKDEAAFIESVKNGFEKRLLSIMR
jgi:multicomponent Na+:H+ antiporter subunit E